MTPALSSAALTELAFAELDFIREARGTKRCQKEVAGRRAVLERFPGKLTAMSPEMMDAATARKQALDALGERCRRCARCPMADE